MGRRSTYRSELRACAVEQHGHVTQADLERLGVPADLVAGLLHDGELVAVSPELYRLDAAPRSLRQALAGAVLGVGRTAALSHDAVLALHGLVEHEPHPVRVTTPEPVRGRTWPDGVEVVHRALDAEDLTTYHGIRSTTVARALLDSRAVLAAAQLAAAAEQAVEHGLLLRRERHLVLDALLDVRLDLGGV